MIPPELPPEILQLPETDRPTIVLVTGNGLRHRRFALRMQQAFAAQVVGWFELDEKQALRASEGSSPSQISRDSGAKHPTRQVEQGHPLKRSARRLRALAKRDPLADYYRSLVVAEQTIFAEEVAELAGYAVVAPTSVHPADVNNADFLATLQKLVGLHFNWE